MSSSTVSSRARQGGGGARQFPVGRRRRYAPVVDAGCGGCRPRRPRLPSLPSFLSRTGSSCRLGGGEAAVTSGGGERYCSSTSTDSFSSSSCGATHSSTGYSSSAYSSSDYCYCYAYGGGAAAAGTKQQQQPPALQGAAAAAAAASPARAPASGEKELMGKKQARKNKKKRGDSKTTAQEPADVDAGVGVAVEKESSDPRADFRDSMVQMVVETGIRDWDGLRGMLRRLLALNAPRHHAAILAAFAEVCAQIIAAPPASATSPSSYQYRR